MTKKALVTGITGQDGAYLAKFLLEQGYQVYGSYRKSATYNDWRLNELGIAKQVHGIELELGDLSSMLRVLEKVKPVEVYNLAAQSFVASSFEQPLHTSDVNAFGPARLLEAVRTVDSSIRFYQASTSEMFGLVQQIPQTEKTPFYPRSPYGVAKLYAHWITVNYREAYDMFACSGILFNHESPLRGREFVTRKITSTLAKIKHGQEECLELGNLDAKRDWGFAGDYVQGMWRMLQQDKADDYVLATGEMWQVRQFIEVAARLIGFDLTWSGTAESETGVDSKTGNTIVRINPEHYRPAEVELLIGSPAKAEAKLGWKRVVSFEQLVEMMVKSDMDKAAKGLL